jgi:hypothetical protein
MRTGRRWVGCCLFCTRHSVACKWCITAGHSVLKHSKTIHPEREGFVGYIKVIKLRVKNGAPSARKPPLRVLGESGETLA